MTACVIAATLIFVVGLFAVIVDRTNERDEAREERDRLERECNAHAAENARLTAQVAATYVGDKGTRLQLVEGTPDAEWPAIVRAVEGEIGGAS